jgi:prephenate dehydrogenase
VPASFDRIAVLGLGLIGGSILQALARGGYRVSGYDPDPVEAGAARGTGYTVAASAAEAVAGADLIVLAMPLPHLEAALIEIGGTVAAGAVVTDVGTLKVPVLQAAPGSSAGTRWRAPSSPASCPGTRCCSGTRPGR